MAPTAPPPVYTPSPTAADTQLPRYEDTNGYGTDLHSCSPYQESSSIEARTSDAEKPSTRIVGTKRIIVIAVLLLVTVLPFVCNIAQASRDHIKLKRRAIPPA